MLLQISLLLLVVLNACLAEPQGFRARQRFVQQRRQNQFENQQPPRFQANQQQQPLVRNQQQSCQGDDVYVDEDPTSCNNFYLCANGTVSLQTCENGLLFDSSMALTDAVHNYCVYNWKVDCKDRPRDDTPISSPGCEYRFGIFPVGDGCRQSYIQCAFGNATEVPCETDNANIPTTLMLSYNQETHSCDWPDLLLDRGCNPQDNNKVYLICVGGQPRLQSCGAIDIWDPENLRCARPRQFFG